MNDFVATKAADCHGYLLCYTKVQSDEQQCMNGWNRSKATLHRARRRHTANRLFINRREPPVPPTPCRSHNSLASYAHSDASDITTIPTCKNYQKLTSSFARHRFRSRRIVSNEPVTDRFGDKSTSMSRPSSTSTEVVLLLNSANPVPPL